MATAKCKYIVLIPLTYNDKTEVPREVLSEIEDQFFLLADGFTAAGTVRGAYRMKNGSKAVDVTEQYWISIEERYEPELVKLCQELAEKLQQESIYCEKAPSTVMFIEPASR